MKKVFKLIGLVAVASTTAMATVIAMNDEKVRTKVMATYETVKNTAREVTGSIADGISKLYEDETKSSTQKNQEWVEDQWEALGI